MKKRSQLLKKPGLLFGTVFLCMLFGCGTVYAEKSDKNISGLSEERKERILTSYILDVEDILPDGGSLRIRVINSYDDVLKEEDAKQDLSDTLYTVCDINGDAMPELVVKSPDGGSYTYKLYTYNRETDQVENISESGIKEMDAEGKLDFRYAYPKKIWEDSADINADEQEEYVSVYAVSNEKGYVCIIVYVNGSKALPIQVKNNANKADIYIYPVKNQKALFYLRLYSDTEDEYCAILQLSEGQFKEMVNMDGEEKTATEKPMAYGRTDLDRDGTKELILRRYTADASEGGEYIYHVYHYDKGSKEYTELPDALFYSRAAGKQVFFQKETGHLIINETMGNPCYGVYSMSNGALHREYEISDDISGISYIKFKRMEFEQESPEITEDQNNSDSSDFVEIHQSEETTFLAPFYGIWCYGSKGADDAYSYANSLSNAGFSAGVYLTTDWSNLNAESYYVVTAGEYETEGEANANLAAVQIFCPDAYIKYSGNYQGQ